MSTCFLSRDKLPAHAILSALWQNGFSLMEADCSDSNWVWTDGKTFVHSDPIAGTEHASFAIYNSNYMPESLQADLDLLSEHDDDHPAQVEARKREERLAILVGNYSVHELADMLLDGMDADDIAQLDSDWSED